MYTHPQHNGGEEIKLLRQEAGKWLKRLRENRGLSQSELASKLGVDYYNFISQIEAGRSRVPPDRYEAWAEAVDMDAHLFVRKLMQFYDPITYKIIYSQGAPLSAN
jgi:hypothetical protein